MHKIDSNGATIDNKFTEGSVSLVIPATVVSAAWLNAVQGEIVKVVEEAGLTLLTSGTDTEDQLLTAIQTLIGTGGSAAPITQSIVNNQASPAVVTDFPVVLTTEIVAIEFFYRVLRRTDSSYVVESGRAYLTWDSEGAAWLSARQGAHDDSGIALSMVSTGNPDEYELKYTSDNIAGSSYAGELKIIDVKTILA